MKILHVHYFTILLYHSNYVSNKITVPQTPVVHMKSTAFCISNLSRAVEYILRL